MSDILLLKALKSQPKNVNLNNKHLKKLPKLVGKLTSVLQLELKHNQLSELPDEFGQLEQLEVLNIGNNKFEDLPSALRHCINLLKLHAFSNNITSLNPIVLNNLDRLTVLNLNHNLLKTLPPEICRLANLEVLSVEHNELVELPFEMCALMNLKEFRANCNKLQALPLEFGFLMNLEQLHLAMNKLKELPENLGKCYKLRVLDIAANELRIFPTEFIELPLKEFYWEENPLLKHMPVKSIQEEEVLSLKEIAARFVMKELKDRWSYLRRSIRHYPAIREMLSQSSRCALCGEAFLNTWLECVRFIDSEQINTLKITPRHGGNKPPLLPVRALLCSYKCFNSSGHKFYGVAFPQ
ncbi:DgyrCDS199 [Dimorphilus gyrociliatus]|uniref:DgyrCDS199 n=1 Tax=Dimorphilus gyrociliatus TaxID=2664684 RepID=A0A7I8V5L0_9ANNE|nr:DgyrCDS199 [Dimorphilus gyrociliatus]